jgi:glycerophosphoryl diester phosphodiesterase
MAALDGSTAPPNSLEGVRASLEAGARFIEVDVNALSNRDYLLVHDDLLQSETSGQGLVIECPPEQARTFTIRHQEVITSFPVALLSDVVTLFLEFGGTTTLQLDYKNVVPLPSDEPLQRLLDLIEPLGSRVIVSSGADWQLRRLRKMAPWLTLGFDVMWYIDWHPAGHTRDPREFPKHIGAYGYYDDTILATEKHWPAAEYLRDRCESLLNLVPDVSVFYMAHGLLAQSLRDGFNWMEVLHEHGIKVDAWTIDVTNPVAVEHAQMLLPAGVDLFTSNTPKALAQLLHLDHERPSK